MSPRNKIDVKRWAILIILVVLLFAGGNFIYNQLVFRVSRVFPSPKAFPTAAPYVDIHFNQTLAGGQDFTASTFIDHGVIERLEVGSKRLRIYLGPLENDQTYTITLKQVKSAKNKQITDKRIVFTARYIEFEKLPKELQQAILKDQDSQGVSKDPVLDLLPYFNAHFELRAQTTSDDKLMIVFVYQPGFADIREGDTAKQRYIQEAKDYLTKNGVDLTKYQFVDSEVLDNIVDDD